jgi:hypothetical protein
MVVGQAAASAVQTTHQPTDLPQCESCTACTDHHSLSRAQENTGLPRPQSTPVGASEARLGDAEAAGDVCSERPPRRATAMTSRRNSSGNGVGTVFILPARTTVLTGQGVNQSGGRPYLTAVAILLTIVYVVGLIFRPTKRVLGMGVDSLVILVLYVVSVAGPITLSGGTAEPGAMTDLRELR